MFGLMLYLLHKSELLLNAFKLIPFNKKLQIKLFLQIVNINVWASGRRTGCCTLTLGGETCRPSNASSEVQVKIMQVMFRQE
jgi:hypothetical protein